MFDPQLSGYWGSTDISIATSAFLDLIREHSDKVDGVKVSLLSAEHEMQLRSDLPAGVRLYTGDDFNYPELIEGDGAHHSDALLGAFAAIAPAASACCSPQPAWLGDRPCGAVPALAEPADHRLLVAAGGGPRLR